ncbi:MAG: PLP-dependent aminotransferase family protein [Sulfurospirillum sp.]
MKNLYAKRAQNYKRSFTREILELTSRASVISFAGGLPDVSLFPKNEIEEEIKNVVKSSDNSLFQYSSANGAKELRKEIAKRYFNTQVDDILLTSGSQQGLDIVCKTFIDSGDLIVVESPSYLVALNLFKMYGAKILDVKLSKNGVDTQELEKIFKERRPKFFYVIPIFQNPTGWTWNIDTRKKVADLAREYGVLIIEDSPYDALNYNDVKIVGFDKLLPKQTITLGTFSKVLAPDFRIGWMRAKREFVEIFQSMKENSDLQSSRFFQLVTANMIKSKKLALHIELLKRVYKDKRDAMAMALDRHFGGDIEFQIPKGGMFFWIKFNDKIDTVRLFDFTIRYDIAFVPGAVFFNSQNSSSYARLNFTNAGFDEIEEGIKRLKRGYMDYIQFIS